MYVENLILTCVHEAQHEKQQQPQRLTIMKVSEDPRNCTFTNGATSVSNVPPAPQQRERTSDDARTTASDLAQNPQAALVAEGAAKAL